MTNQEIIIKYLLNSKSNLRTNVKKLLTDELVKLLNIDKNKEINAQLFCLYHDLKYDLEIKCPVCGNIRKFVSFRLGFKSACGASCAMKSENYKEKMKNKYGGTNFQREDIRDKCKTTLKERYGVENPGQSEQIRNKVKQTNLELYGVENPGQSEHIKNKIKTAMQERYGVEHFSKCPEFGIKFRTTMQKRYGVNNPLQLEQIRNKVKQTHLEKYGVEHITQTSKFKNSLGKRQKLKAFNRILGLTKVKPLFKFEEYLNCTANHLYQCQKCNNIFEDNIDDGSEPSCTVCKPKFISNIQLEIEQFLTLNKINFIRNDRTQICPKEIDIFIPSYNLGIEINGLYWHKNDKKRSLEKLELCQNKGITLIQIFEDEILLKKNIIFSRLSSLLNLNNTLYGRKCEIKEISNKQANDFFNKNHLQGGVNAKVAVGLFFDKKLVAAMSFGTSRFIKTNKPWELLRFASLLNNNVVGGANKLFQWFLKEHSPNKIISYADRRWSNGNLYYNLGFTLSKISQPNYFYFKNKQR